MNKELEEAIKILTEENSTWKKQKAIKNLRDYIDNSISKEVVEKKIEEVIKLIENEQFKVIMGDTTICSRIKYILKEELLEGK